MAATKVFLAISASEASLEVKGKLMMLASRMMEDPESVGETDFDGLPGGVEIFQMISAAVGRSHRARERAAARRRQRMEETGPSVPVEEKKPEQIHFPHKSAPTVKIHNLLYNTKLRYHKKAMRRATFQMARSRLK